MESMGIVNGEMAVVNNLKSELFWETCIHSLTGFLNPTKEENSYLSTISCFSFRCV
ncbi:hypothetical protein XBFFL1_2720016 [Xenorhabdus bovienii str. feltiae Florida]|uniref:Uncharacterized protein n=1 Tax=Xenorhabdus bovienii str. kraussei Becker Underwood TaxID=1398204 RepID=A0A077PFZ2_XENBV|nr:hypothetical protein XBFFL1_2720016 [Xenorhabdus bovienii str. feltiae Florida]CDH23255.1 hypothetical protein XBKB1_1620002 [Xenorhabdus bovienii str. kraussei Becker Underwood]